MIVAATSLPTLIWRSIASPDQVGAGIAGLRLPRDALWMALALATVVSVLAMNVTGPADFGPAQPARPGPLAQVLILGSLLVMAVFALHFAGRALGGAGRFGTALAMVAWLEVMGVTLRLAGFGLGVLLGPVASAALPALAAGLLIWITLHFVRALHGFAGLGGAVATLVLALLTLGLGLGLLLLSIDILSQGGLSRV